MGSTLNLVEHAGVDKNEVERDHPHVAVAITIEATKVGAIVTLALTGSLNLSNNLPIAILDLNNNNHSNK